MPPSANTEQQEALTARELQIAHEIQQSFLPHDLPSLGCVEIAAEMRPARQVGGDFYDVLSLTGQRAGVLVADVSGKGVPAALYMALARTLLRAFSLQARPRYLSDALQSAHLRHLMHSGSLGALAALGAVAETNEYLVAHHAEASMFLTLFYGVYDPDTRLLTYVNAGHNPPLLYSVSGDSHTWLEPTGMAIGLFPGFPFEPQERHLSPDDILVIYSDGVTEAFNAQGEMFKRQRLLDTVRTHATHPAPELVSAIKRAVDDFAGARPQSDDMTLLVLRCPAA